MNGSIVNASLVISGGEEGEKSVVAAEASLHPIEHRCDDNTTLNLLEENRSSTRLEEARLPDTSLSLSVSFSCRSLVNSRLGNLSCMEVHNRHVFDRVTLAVSCSLIWLNSHISSLT